jgi:hypothetical protein
MDILTWLAEHAEPVVVAVSALNALVLLWFTIHFPRRTEFEQYKRDVKAVDDEQDRRIAAADAARVLIEQRLAALPTSEDTHQLRIAVTQMGGDLKALQAQIAGQAEILNIVKHVTDRLNGFLMERGRGVK